MSKYTQSYRGVGEMLCMPEIQLEMLVRAHAVADFAEAIAPVDTGSGHPGRYKASFEVSSGVRKGKFSRANALPRGVSGPQGPRTRESTGRAFGRVTNTAPEALFVEFGTVHNPKHRTLGRALLEAGG